MRAKIVVGLGFGDEGKGKTVDYLCAGEDKPIAIRFSGGSQAGHTVHLKNKIHIHRNFASGALRGVPSYFTEHTCVDPVQILSESELFDTIPDLTVHPRAALITPYDIEANRKTANKDTCGMGIGETMRRQEQSPYRLYAVDTINTEILSVKLDFLAGYYGFEISDTLKKNFIKSCEDLFDSDWFQIRKYDYLREFRSLIFEGSQGILLDREYGFFPCVTYAHTTSKNALEVCEKLGIEEASIYYVTRAYQTRHGQGPMFDTGDIKLSNKYESNYHNEMQGEFRVRQFSPEAVIASLTYDSMVDSSIRVKPILMVTCTDVINQEEFPMEKFLLLISVYDEVYYSDTPKSQFKTFVDYEFFGRKRLQEGSKSY